MGRVIRLGIPMMLALVIVPLTSGAEPRRVAYFYDYMGVDHLDSLASARFDRALVRLIEDSVDADVTLRLEAFVTRGRRLGITVTPDLLFQAAQRLGSLGTARRYTWGNGIVERNVACPLDTAYWRSGLFDHVEEVLRAVPGLAAVAIDLELYGAGRHHYDAGPCRCAACLAEYTGESRTAARDAWRLSGMLAYQESRLSGLLAAPLQRFAERHPGVELGVLDLDYDSFVRRAFARALARARGPTVDYCERSYRHGGVMLPGARARLDALGLRDTPIVGGLWLKRWNPRDIAAGARSILKCADGYFAFTTYSLWLDPSRLSGPYTLQGTPSDYWRAFREVNRSP